MNTDSKYIIKKDLTPNTLWQKGSPLLGRLDIELTERCNNNCIHCYINQPEDDQSLKNKELSTKALKDILKQAADLGCLALRFTGGEPLLRNDFKELYLYTRRLGIKVILFTNGTLINSELVELFTKYPPGEKIEITLYGLDEKTYESVSRAKGSFRAAMKGIHLLLEGQIPFIIKSTYISGKQDKIEEFDEFSDMIPYMEHSPSFSMNFDLRARRDSEKKIAFIKSLRATKEDTIRIISKKKDDYIKGMKQFVEKFMRPGGDAMFTCGCGKGGSVDAYGYFQPCLLMRHPVTLYDLKNGSFTDAIENYFVELRKKKSTNPEYLEKCAKCFLNGLCERCPAKSWMEHGKLDTPVDYYCEIAHAKAELLGLVEKEEKAWEVVDWQERIDRFVKE